MKNSFRNLTAVSVLISASAVLAAPPETTTYFGGVWSGIGFVLGYGNEAAYVKYACNGTDPGTGKDCDGPPREGMTRKFASLGDSFIAAGGYATCAEIPTSGTKAVTVSGVASTLTFSTPKQKIPAAWTGGGTAFDRRIEFSFVYAGTETIKAAFEASCTYEQTGLMAMNMLVGSQAVGFERAINVWTGKKSGLSVADVYTIERTSATGKTRSDYAYNVEINETAKTYKMVGTMSNYFGSGNSEYSGIDVFNVNGNFNTHQLTMRNKRFLVSKGNGQTGNPLDTSNTIESMTGSDDALLTAATGFALLTATTTSVQGPVDGAQGCLDFDTDTIAPTSNAACTGLDFLTEAPTPVIDATGKFSPKWLLNTAKGKLLEIPTL